MFFALRFLLQTSLSMFNKREFSVKRRFSDFLGLHSKLATKYMHIGYIVPPAPEKSIVGEIVVLSGPHGPAFVVKDCTSTFQYKSVFCRS